MSLTRPKPFQLWILLTIPLEVVLVVVTPHFSSDFWLNGSLIHSTSLAVTYNNAIQTFWTAEISSALLIAIFVIIKRANYSLGQLYAWPIMGLFGIYGLYEGFYYVPYYPLIVTTTQQTVFPYLVVANLYLVAISFGGWLLGKGLECANKPAFWRRRR
jgi:hypothetical protein